MTTLSPSSASFGTTAGVTATRRSPGNVSFGTPRIMATLRLSHTPIIANMMTMLYVLVLATFIGLGVVTRVSRLLHTPLMSLTNAISAIAVVGSLVITGQDHPPVIRLMGAVALAASMTNIVSGFLITDRMLRMFRKPGERK
jgi:NAD(P) transhydrogenase subunit alpha